MRNLIQSLHLEMSRIVNKMLVFVLRIIVNGVSLNLELENGCFTIQAIYFKLGVYLMLFRGIENGTSFPYRVFCTEYTVKSCGMTAPKIQNILSWSTSWQVLSCLHIRKYFFHRVRGIPSACNRNVQHWASE